MWRRMVTPVSAPAAAFRFLEIPSVSMHPSCETVEGRRSTAATVTVTVRRLAMAVTGYLSSEFAGLGLPAPTGPKL